MKATADIAVNSPYWTVGGGLTKLFPKYKMVALNPIVDQCTEVDHPFLQLLIDIKAVVTIMQGDWLVLAYESLILLHVYDGFINLECIATPVEYRGKGSAKKTMEALVAISDETGIPIRLRACNVTGHGWNMLPQNVVVAAGMKKPGKIPVAQLPAFYEKFGFEKLANVYHKGKPEGYNMIYNPKKK